MTTEPAPKKSGLSTGKTVLIMVICFGVGLAATYFITSTPSDNQEEVQKSNTLTEKLDTTSGTMSANEQNAKRRGNALGIKVPTFQFASDVQAYIGEVVKAPIPADYVLPENVMTQPDYDQAVDQVGNNYPIFKGKEGQDLVYAVQEYPYQFQEMIREFKAAREKFFPGTQPKY